MSNMRTVKDSMGEMQVPADALYAAQTQRAVNNFPISGLTFNRAFVKALGIVKKAAALANEEMGTVDAKVTEVIKLASQEVMDGKWDDQFVIDIFQTGSGTSSNMNANEVIATRASQIAKEKGYDFTVHPNDHVNFGQSSNDVIPTALRIATAGEAKNELVPALNYLADAFEAKGEEYKDVVKTGRTHLMDAMPVTIKQQFSGYVRQLRLGADRIEDALKRLVELPQGGTAVGTGINTDPKFGATFAAKVTEITGMEFIEAINHFEAQATVDAPVELSSQLKTISVGLLKMANDLRWMNSGPNSGLGEIQLAALQPGSSIMPGKVNPVIEEATAMVAAQIIGNDATITIAGQSGNFELNVMLPVVAHNLLQSIELMTNTCKNFADKSVKLIVVRTEKIKEKVLKNPILVTALNPIIGYDLAAKIAKTAFAEERSLIDVTLEMTDLTREEVEKILDPIKLTQCGVTK